jgi:lysophospholipase L1-like esterase
MKKWLIALGVILIALAVYLNRGYSKMYDRNDSSLSEPYFSRNLMLPGSKNNGKTLKYIALGDSLSTGLGSDDYKKTLPYKFAEILAKSNNINLINLAVSGATTKDVIHNQLPSAIKENPDYITLFIGVNDLHNLTSASEYLQNMETMIDELKNSTKAKVVLINLPFLGSDKIIIPPYNSLIDAQTLEFNKILEGLAKKYNLTLVDLYTPTKNIYSKNEVFYSEDQFHPSGKGYEMWGEALNAYQY